MVHSALKHVVVFRPDLEVVSAASFGQTDEQRSSQARLSHFGPFDPFALKTKSFRTAPFFVTNNFSVAVAATDDCPAPLTPRRLHSQATLPF